MTSGAQGVISSAMRRRNIYNKFLKIRLLVCGSSGDLLKSNDQPRQYGSQYQAPPTYVAIAEKFYYVGAQDGSLR